MLKKLYRKNFKRIYVKLVNKNMPRIICSECLKENKECPKSIGICKKINKNNFVWLDHYWYIPDRPSKPYI